MKRKTRLAMSVVSGVAATMIAMAYASTARAEGQRARDEAFARYGGDMVQVCVATRDIEPGESIDEANTGVEEWVATLLPAGAETSLAKAVGKTATSRIPERAVLCPGYFEEQPAAVDVPEGMVAVSVACDEEHAVGGAIESGDAVDVYVSRDGVADRLCKAEVIDTSTRAEGSGKLAWVTLGVEPGRVEELLIATGRAPATLVVPAGDGEAADMEGEES